MEKDNIENELVFFIDLFIDSLTEHLPRFESNPQYQFYEISRYASFSSLKYLLKGGNDLARNLYLSRPGRVRNLLIEQYLKISNEEYNLMLKSLKGVSRNLKQFLNMNIPELPADYTKDINDYIKILFPPVKLIKIDKHEICSDKDRRFLIEVAESYIEDVKMIKEWFQFNNAKKDIAVQKQEVSDKNKQSIQAQSDGPKAPPTPIKQYCTVITRDETHSKRREGYQELKGSIDDYDIFIDGCTSQAWHKENDKLIGPVTLTFSEYMLLREYITNKGVMRPMTALKNHTNSYRAALQHFKNARKKVDVRIGKQNWICFKPQKNIEAEYKGFEFSPPQDFKYCLIEPIIS
ncbi:MAG: hypothetical protein GY839_12390 [candidate division Zixibacteria bacterium]|nr:hypothetical protein [candidate division Zixibacteria bacterium]